MSAASLPKRRANERNDEQRRQVGRCVATWRRLVLTFGPKAALPVAMFTAENARADGAAVVSRPTRKSASVIAGLDASTVERRIGDLVATAWLHRVGPRAVKGTAQTYELTIPDDVEQAAVDEAFALKEGMWERLADLKQARKNAGQSATKGPRSSDQRPAFRSLQTRILAGPTGFNGISTGRARAPEGGAALDEARQAALSLIANGYEPEAVAAATVVPIEELIAMHERFKARQQRPGPLAGPEALDNFAAAPMVGAGSKP